MWPTFNLFHVITESLVALFSVITRGSSTGTILPATTNNGTLSNGTGTSTDLLNKVFIYVGMYVSINMYIPMYVCTCM